MNLVKNTPVRLPNFSRAVKALRFASIARKKTLVDPGPFALKGDRSRCHEIEHLLHGANTSCGEPGPIKRDADLILSGSPAKIALEFAGLLKVGDIADGGDDRCRRAFADGGDREQDLPFTTELHDISDFRVKALQVFLDQPQFFD
jgi:hypothetical protein